MLLGLLFQNPLIFAYLVAAIILAITVHEASHAYVATRLGDPTPKMQGRVTLNPLAHLDPLGTFALLVAGFGWGKPVVYNPNYVKGGQAGELWIALAGPLSNLILAFLFALPYRIGLIQGVDITNLSWMTFVSVVVEINIVLAAFNLIPIPPLDGSKILYLALDKISGGSFDHRTLEQVGPLLLLGLIFAQAALHIDILGHLINPLMAIFRFIVAGVSFPVLF
jgi:Zn-dependent protease